MAKVRKSIGAASEKRRPPLVDKRNRMWYPKDPSKYRVNVTDKLLTTYLDSGFRHVRRDELREQCGEGGFDEGSEMGAYVSWNVGRADGRENARGWLLEMPMDQWLNDLKPQIAAERARPMEGVHEEMEAMIKSGKFYAPPGFGKGIKFGK